MLQALQVMDIHEVMVREVTGSKPNRKGRILEQRIVDNYSVSPHGAGKRFRMVRDKTKGLKEPKEYLFIIRTE